MGLCKEYSSLWYRWSVFACCPREGHVRQYSMRVTVRRIGVSMTNSSAIVAPLFGIERMLGTNPIAIAFPGEQEKPIVIDLATSVVPWGRIEEFARTGEALQPGWAIGADGADELNPNKVLVSGALQNLGGERASSGHKGYALAAMVDILCSVLSGGNWGPTVDNFTTHAVNYGSEKDAGSSDDEEKPVAGIGHFFGAMRIDGFREPSAFKRTIDAWVRTFRGCKPADPAQPVLVPGDPEWDAQEQRRAHGVPVKLAVIADMIDVGKALGVPLPFNEADVNLEGVKRVLVDSA
eukprot:TRINITY_DN15551_c0_g1_i4.p1 TRINITY_DN15551_c0_g1~~TRINITY_DN15551_c0_g1_i4.p1  ORF type:complete len:293 (-),score=64.00 TRINITY_DN15551_c0_g1_i4:101-979(-)